MEVGRMRVAFAIALCATASTIPCAAADKPKTSEASAPRPAEIKVAEHGTRKFFTDTKGMTLYTFDRDTQPDKSTCNAACATAWPPLKANAEGTAPEGWSIVTRDDGTKQWAFRGKPLYLFARDSKAGETTGDGVNGVWKLAVVPKIIPPMPAGIRLQKTTLGQVFADASGKTFYFQSGKKAKCEGDCTTRWAPVPAAMMARPIGEWSIVRRSDGTRQWAYGEKPLYTYAGDFTPGQVNGQNNAEGSRAEWQAAVQESEPRPEQIGLRQTLDGPLFVNERGMTLYALERSGLAGTRVGSAQPGAAVCDVECLRTWQPLRPRTKSAPIGMWSVITRADGSLQWAYDNKAVYTYIEDKKPGDSLGDILELHVDGRAHSWRALRPM